MNNFVAIDFETANSNSHSICQIGIVEFQNNVEISCWETLINPNDKFSRYNTLIHGIHEKDVITSPTFSESYEKLCALIGDKVVVSHGSFDRTAMKRAIEKNGLRNINNKWIDSTAIARQVLNEYSNKGYNLQNLANHFEIATIPHNALDDARTCGLIFNKLLNLSNKSIEEWFNFIGDSVKRRVDVESLSVANKLEPNKKGKFFGISIAITGALDFGSRHQAHEIISSYGFTIHNNIRKDTDYLLIGKQVAHNIGVNGKSDKEEALEKSLKDGGKIRPITEDDFRAMCGIDSIVRTNVSTISQQKMSIDTNFDEAKIQELLSNPNIEIELLSPDQRYKIVYTTSVVAKEIMSPTEFYRSYYLYDMVNKSIMNSPWDTYIESKQVSLSHNLIKFAKYSVTRISKGWKIVCPKCAIQFKDNIWRNSPRNCIDQEHGPGCGQVFKDEDKKMIPLQ